MIKGVMNTVEGPALFIGLSGENVTRLMADEPIKFNLSELGLPPLVVVIAGGRTEDSIMADLQANGVKIT